MHEAVIVLVRGVIGFFSLLIFTRILGKQQVSQLTLFEYILGITIGSMAATLTTDLASTAWSHWVGLMVWTILVFAVQHFSVKYPKFFVYINGQPEMLIINGKIMEETMKKMRYSLHDLMEQLRVSGVFDISQVEYAVLETNGKLTVLKKSQYQSLTPKDMNLSTSYDGLSTELVFNGVILKYNLSQLHLDTLWLKQELRKKGIKDVSEVYFASLNTKGELYVDLIKDKIVQESNVEHL